MSIPLLLLLVTAYIALLFFLARWGDSQSDNKQSWVRHPLVYALALGVYCTSWTFYGLVGTASQRGWEFFTILFGVILLFTIGFPLLERIYTVCRQQKIHSIADFLASRYGNRQGVAATVTIVVFLSTIPYIALQLKAVADTLVLIVANSDISQDLTFLVAISMMVFALVFGAMKLDMSGYHSGLMTAIAFESLVKVVVLIAIAVFAVIWINNGNIVEPVSQFFGEHQRTRNVPWLRVIVEILLASCAIVCLPRMFHVTFVEAISLKHIRYARWTFTAYLVFIALSIVIIAAIGNQVFPKGSGISGDTYVLQLPLIINHQWMAAVAFLGGFSAATAMIIVATITLSQMLSNDVVLPLIIKRKKKSQTTGSFSKGLMLARRLTVCVVVLAAYFYQTLLAENAALTSIGLIAFALVVQLAPAIFIGLYWRKGNATGLYIGLVVGVLLWFYTLMIPLLSDAGFISSRILQEGLGGVPFLRPEYLFNFSFSDSFTRGVIISLSANLFCYFWYSMTSNESLNDRIQAVAFTRLEVSDTYQYDNIKEQDLRSLLKTFVGDEATDSVFIDYDYGDEKSRSELVSKAQQTLAGVVGVASSKSMLDSLNTGEKIGVEDVVNLFDKTATALRFNQEVLFASFENISSGVSVVDNDLRLIAWNQHYEDLFEYPDNTLNIGMPVEKIMRFNGERGFLGDENPNEAISRRLQCMESGDDYEEIRYHQTGRVIQMIGRALPHGGYVTTYNDITSFIDEQKRLENQNLFLEERVQERTHQVEEINRDLMDEIKNRMLVEKELREAKKVAEEANASKTKFLALASHDILQPLNAANLYVNTLLDSSSQSANDGNIIHQLQSAIHNTESIISTLLEVSKIDSGAFQADTTEVDVGQLLESIVSEFQWQTDNGVTLKYCSTSTIVKSNPHYLYRILQNFVSNAIKYTQQGKILVGCRRVKNDEGENFLRICVYDTGVGISEQEKSKVFDDFYRVPASGSFSHVPGVGLGLSVVNRFSQLLGHSVSCESEQGKGSCFSITVPVSSKPIVKENQTSRKVETHLQGITIVYVDDEIQNLEATAALLNHWQCNITLLDSIDAAIDFAQNNEPPQVLLMDYQLDRADISGVELAKTMLSAWAEQDDGISVGVCIVSAMSEEKLADLVDGAGFHFLSKPLKPARLRALLMQMK